VRKRENRPIFHAMISLANAISGIIRLLLHRLFDPRARRRRG
jgi:hypothetical protein